MNKKSKISIAALAAAVIASGTFYSAYLAQSGTEAEELCQTRDEAMANTQGKMDVKEPTYLPEGYHTLCADGTPEIVLLFYGQADSANKEEANRVQLIEDGAILVAAKRYDAETDDAYNTRDREAEIRRAFEGVDPKVETRLTEINGNLAAVREMCEDCSKSFVTQEDGSTEQMGTSSMPSVIEFYDGDMKYRIEAYLLSAELEKVAQSLE
ncbi:hypothetical protein [Candidatus Nitrososphaera sp. FF02]|uniref:hypothetical protein n=1 Tax=Candidatus Nitrososphaera sp. FF02 TaxID=3398226 RepID=UPI0039EB169C